MSPRDENDWPLGPDEPAPDQEELELARRLGAATERLIGGEALPGEMDGDELITASRMIRSAGGAEEHLSSERKQELVALALDQAGHTSARTARRPVVLRAAPYLALAASIVLLLSALMVGLPTMRDRAAPQPARPQLLSRPSNDLMGRPFKDRAGAARRLDLVFADRLHGYRQVRLATRTTTVMP
jgi:hypothetical protein